uniref:Uncharacterized protein n=1 Tax=Salix viminalis TaxID=40686 RepID=A0A6N2M4T3_SALVM
MQIAKEFICSCGVAFVAVSDKHAWQHIIPSNSLLSLTFFSPSFAILSLLLLFNHHLFPSLSTFFSLSSFSVLATRRKLRGKKEISNSLLIFVIRLDLRSLLYWIISFKDQGNPFSIISLELLQSK